ncbi:uncharacterized protein LACBIDRAFT_326870, partial [Laccaria bicolor S238N-H82]
ISSLGRSKDTPRIRPVTRPQKLFGQKPKCSGDKSNLEAPSKSHGISIVTFWLDIRTFPSTFVLMLQTASYRSVAQRSSWKGRRKSLRREKVQLSEYFNVWQYFTICI